MKPRTVLLGGAFSGAFFGGALGLVAVLGNGPAFSIRFASPADFVVDRREPDHERALRALLACAAGGLVFGGCMAAVLAARRVAAPGDLAPGERVLRSGLGARKALLPLGADLHLTDRRLLLRPRGWTTETAVEWKLADIAAVEPAPLLAFIPNAFRLTLADHARQIVIVGLGEAAGWVEAIEAARVVASHPATGPP